MDSRLANPSLLVDTVNPAAPAAPTAPTGPATPNGRRNSNADWEFPFPLPGRWKGKKKLPANTERRQPWVDVDAVDPTRDHAALRAFADRVWPSSSRTCKTFVDDVGVVSIDHPALAHERRRDPLRLSARALAGRDDRRGEQGVACSRATCRPPTTSSTSARSASSSGDTRSLRYLKTLGAAGLTTTIGWPQEVSVRWADKIWPLSHKLVAQAAGLGIIGTSRNFLHQRFGAYCLIDTVLTNLEFAPAEYDEAARPLDWNPCLECNLCVASCPTDAIKADGEFDFFACYNHTYRDSIPGFLDLVRDLGEAKPKKFEHRWSDAEIAALWQSMAFRVEYRCFNCVATCPAEIHDAFHADKRRARATT